MNQELGPNQTLNLLVRVLCLPFSDSKDEGG